MSESQKICLRRYFPLELDINLVSNPKFFYYGAVYTLIFGPYMVPNRKNFRLRRIFKGTKTHYKS